MGDPKALLVGGVVGAGRARQTHPVDAALTGRVLYVAQNLTVTVDSLNLTRGAGSDGGAVYLGAGTNVNLYASHVYSNTATAAGGAIHSVGATLTPGSRIVGDLGPSNAKGYARSVAAATLAEVAVARGEILDATDADAVRVWMGD